MAKTPKRPRDGNQLAHFIVQAATGEITLPEKLGEATEKNAAAVALGRLGGQKGGKARADKLTSEQRKTIAQKAAAARWKPKSE